jgi:hypothetical protein
MSCDLTHEILLADTAVRARDAEALEAHARLCPDCDEVLTTTRNARLLLSEGSPRPALGAPERVWRGMQAGLREPALLQRLRHGWLMWAPSPTAVAAVGATFAAGLVALGLARALTAPPAVRVEPLLLAGSVSVIEPRVPGAPAGAPRRETERGAELPVGAWFKMDQPVALAVGRGRIDAGRGSMVFVPRPERKGATSVMLERGLVRAQVEHLGHGESFELVTHQATVQVIGTKFRVLAESGSSLVTVEEGVVSVWPVDAAAPVRVRSGEQLRVSDVDGKRILLGPTATGLGAAQLAAPPPATAPAAAVTPVVDAPAAAAAAAPAVAAAPIQLDPITVAPPKNGAEARRALDAARAALPSDAQRAAALAENVLRAQLADVEADALAILADAHRRAGRSAEAAEVYARLAALPSGKAYAEEALYQRALLLSALGRRDQAAESLARAREAFPGGPLAPERAALEAKFLAEAGRSGEAAAAFARAAASARALGDAASAAAYDAEAARLGAR